MAPGILIPAGLGVFGRARFPSDETEQVAGDLAHLDLFRTFGDPVATVVAVDVFERLMPRIPHAAVDLHRPVSHLADQPIGPVVAHRHLVGQRPGDFGSGHPVHFPSGLADQLPQHLDLRRGLDKWPLDCLVDRERLAERRAFLGIFHTFGKAIASRAQRACGLPNAVFVDESLCQCQPVLWRAKDGVFRHPDIGDRDPRVVSRHIEGPEPLLDFDAGVGRIDNEGADPLGAACFAGRAAEDGDMGRLVQVGSPAFLATFIRGRPYHTKLYVTVNAILL